jgi:hypothetical protein
MGLSQLARQFSDSALRSVLISRLRFSRFRFLSRATGAGRGIAAPAGESYTLEHFPREFLVGQRFLVYKFRRQRFKHHRLHFPAIVAPAEFLQVGI